MVGDVKSVMHPSSLYKIFGVLYWLSMKVFEFDHLFPLCEFHFIQCSSLSWVVGAMCDVPSEVIFGGKREC